MRSRSAWWLALPLTLVIGCTRGDDTDDTVETDPVDTEDTEVPPVDADMDGYSVDEDCDDSNPAIYPGAPEDDCTDPVDYNCDGDVPLYADADEDGFAACVDCDDADPLVNPAADESCDGVDNDCDELIDDADDDVVDLREWFEDRDLDGYGHPINSVDACFVPEGYVDDNTDCNDTRRDIHPDADEVCDLEDNDCDRKYDDDDDDVVDQGTWYPDQDDDGLGDPDKGVVACVAPRDYIANGFDCDDRDPDGGEASVWYEDRDSDDFGDDARTTVTCTPPTSYVAVGGDCDDLDDEVNPDAPEVCDEKDNDCDKDVDDDDLDVEGQSDWYPDDDDDTYGDEDASAVTACFAPKAHVADNTDCDDTQHVVHPERFDFDDDQDNDCDTAVDEDVGSETYDHDTDMQGVWNTWCTRCHGASGGLSLSSAYTKILGVESSVRGMDYIEPGDLRNSYLWHKIQGTHSSVGGRGASMPFGGSMSSADELKIETWILEGAVR